MSAQFAAKLKSMVSFQRFDNKFLNLLHQIEAGFPPKNQIVLILMSNTLQDEWTRANQMMNKSAMQKGGSSPESTLYFLTMTDLNRLVKI